VFNQVELIGLRYFVSDDLALVNTRAALAFKLSLRAGSFTPLTAVEAFLRFARTFRHFAGWILRHLDYIESEPAFAFDEKVKSKGLALLDLELAIFFQ